MEAGASLGGKDVKPVSSTLLVLIIQYVDALNVDLITLLIGCPLFESCLYEEVKICVV